MSVKFKYTTPLQFLRYIRQKYKNSYGEDACRYAAYVLQQSDADLKDAFGITQGQVTALRARLKTNSDALAAIKLKTGE